MSLRQQPPLPCVAFICHGRRANVDTDGVGCGQLAPFESLVRLQRKRRGTHLVMKRVDRVRLRFGFPRLGMAHGLRPRDLAALHACSRMAGGASALPLHCQGQSAEVAIQRCIP